MRAKKTQEDLSTPTPKVVLDLLKTLIRLVRKIIHLPFTKVHIPFTKIYLQFTKIHLPFTQIILHPTKFRLPTRVLLPSVLMCSRAIKHPSCLSSPSSTIQKFHSELPRSIAKLQNTSISHKPSSPSKYQKLSTGASSSTRQL